MASQRWRVCGLVASSAVTIKRLALLNASGSRVDVGATVYSSVAPTSGDLQTGVAGTGTCVFSRQQVRSSGFFINFDLVSAADVASVDADIVGASELMFQSMVDGAWVSIGVWPSVQMSPVSVTVAGCVQEGDSTGASRVDIVGGIRRSSSTYSGVERVVQSKTTGLYTSVQVDLNITGDSSGLRHSGLVLLDATTGFTGMRVAFQSNARFRPVYFYSSSSLAEVGTTYDVQPPVPNIGQKVTLRLDRVGSKFTASVGGVKSIEFEWNAPLSLFVGMFCYGNTTEFTDLKSGSDPREIVASGFGVQVAAASGLAEHRTLLLDSMCAQDVEFGGLGVFPFQVEGLTGSQKARVMLMRARDGLIAREGWSGADGKGEFTGLDVNTRFIAVGQDPSGLMHPVGASHFPLLREDLP